MSFLRWQLRRVVEFVGARLDARLTVAEVVGSINLGSSHFCREFKRTFGVTVYVYVMRRRIEMAQHRAALAVLKGHARVEITARGK